MRAYPNELLSNSRFDTPLLLLERYLFNIFSLHASLVHQSNVQGASYGAILTV